MSDKELCEAFGTTIDEVESDVDAFENGTWEGFKFGNPVDGKPEAKMRTTSIKFYDFELARNEAVAYLKADLCHRDPENYGQSRGAR